MDSIFHCFGRSSNYTETSGSSIAGSLSGGFTSSGGQTIESVDILAPEVKERFLARFDLVVRFGLNEETSLYRATNSEFIKSSRSGEELTMEGHRHWRGHRREGRMYDHDRVVSNPRHRLDARAMPYIPFEMPVAELKDKSLTVMVGNNARSQVETYMGEDNNTLVEMKLGDILTQGGRVYEDTSSLSNTNEVTAVVVTLPKRAIPVKIIDTYRPRQR